MKKYKSFTVWLLVCAIQALSFSAYSAYLTSDDSISSVAEYSVEATDVPVECVEDGEEAQLELMSELSAPDDSKAERFIVKYKRDRMTASNMELRADLSGHYNIKSVKEVEFTTSRGIGLFSDGRAEEFQIIELNEAVDIEEFSDDIKSAYSIEYVQPDYKIELSAEYAANPMETEAADTKDEIEDENTEYNTEQNGATELFDANIYNYVSTLVALIDTGVDVGNEALRANIYSNNEEQGSDEDGNGYEGDINGWDFYNNSPDVYNTELGLDQAHGTHIAGVIAETAPNAKILPLKVFENGIAYTSDIIEAIQYADMMGASIVNCSWGCTEDNNALKEAMQNSEMIFVCAAGNNRMNLNETPIYPACYDLENVISVTSVNDDGGLSYFSNYGDVDIAARGRNIESCFPEGETGALTGTSISAGFVSGAMANVYTGAEETIGRLYSTSDKLLNLQSYVENGRRLNLDNLLSNTETNEITDVNPEEDFNSEGYSRTPEDSWELFGALDNIAVAAGRYHLAVLKSDGSVWTWGKNNYGQLGIGSYTNCETPQQVSSISNVAEIKAGENHMIARTADGRVFTWGVNSNGCLGNGSTASSNVPVQMTNGTNAIGIGAGLNISYVIKSGNVLYACGANGYGQIGDGTTTSRTTLTKVSIPESITYVTGGGGASFAITTDGALYSWGHNGYGRLGNGTTTDNYTPQMIIDSNVVDVSMGFFTALAVKNDGTVYKWGYGGTSSPRQVTALSGMTMVVSGRQAEFALGTNTLKSTGMNTTGVLGLGDTQWHYSWGTVEGSFSDFDVYEYRAIGLGTNGYIYIWGDINNDTGEYSVSPEKLSGRVNDFAGDSFVESEIVNMGTTYGRITSDSQKDYYKFIPPQSANYSIYSISSIDLVCEIYTKDDNGGYILQFSDDDAYGSMGVNFFDFCVTQDLVENTEYYIYVYSFSSSSTGDYELHITSSSTDNAYTFSSSANDINSVYINVSNIDTFANKIFKVQYDEAQLLLLDACLFSKEPETVAKAVPGSGVNILSVNNGEILFEINQDIPDAKKMSGTINILQFKSLTDGEKTVRYVIDSK